MVKIDDKALNYVQGENLCFVVCVKKTSINCDCGNCNTTVRTLKIKVLFETEVLDKELYDIYKYQDIKVFVLKDLKVVGDINVYQKAKIPFMQPIFGVKGIIA
ncbi:hypothetical protein [Clostridium ljungdahlii]|uniref:Uncharacterized protein n=1 Tax=Clostridium ljungdahlii TaxID=1538 RepID=A0A162N9J6_9CLOT|nr:hypothetical protein [Clostridium ljungdahlii]OAA90619.1 hypothetical protein WY13_01523 [Clostridium ljungdahlii]